MQGMEEAWPSSKRKSSVQPGAFSKITMKALILGSEAEPLLNTLAIVFCFLQDFHSNLLHLMKILIQKNIKTDGLGELFNNYCFITLTSETLSIFFMILSLFAEG